MNRPRIVGVLSAVLGSTAGFLVLSRWRLAGTITGAVLMPLIFTLVSFGSHESLERLGGWVRCRVKRDAGAAQSTPPKETPAPQGAQPTGHRLQWPVAVLSFLALTVSVYSLTQQAPVGTTILRERVVQTVTVTTDHTSSAYVASGLPSGGQDASTTSTAVGQGGDPTPTTVSTLAGTGDAPTTTTLP